MAPPPAFQEVLVKWGNSKEKFLVPASYEYVKNLGTGSYGSVVSFRDAQKDRTVAVKKVPNALDPPEDGRRIVREIKLLLQLSHNNIIRILDVLPPQSPNIRDVYIVMDMWGDDLWKVMSRQTLEEDQTQYFIYQTLRGLHYLHSADVAHRDLKPENLLVNKSCDLKICDFGLARVLNDMDVQALMTTKYVTTRWYRAPEVVLGASDYTKSIDIWSVGCILCELVGRKPVFNGHDELDQIKKIVSIVGKPEPCELEWLSEGAKRVLVEDCPSGEGRTPAFIDRYPTSSPDAWQAMEAMLRFLPSARVTAAGALRLPFFSSDFDETHREADTRHSPIDWSFDIGLRPTTRVLQNLVYRECAALHPEIIERDKAKLAARGLGDLMPAGLAPHAPRRGLCSWFCACSKTSQRYQAGAGD